MLQGFCNIYQEKPGRFDTMLQKILQHLSKKGQKRFTLLHQMAEPRVYRGCHKHLRQEILRRRCLLPLFTSVERRRYSVSAESVPVYGHGFG